MAHPELTEAQYRLVAAVAEREGWHALEDPPLSGGPRTLAEHAAVMSFRGALPAARGRTPRRDTERIARIVMFALGAAGLIACWLVSPERTAAALLIVGVFCLFALRRRGRRGHGRMPARRRLGW
ncbi:MAG: hypothetical protein IT200_08735 [Thermoleophilia bacterium]|nr:hypothetical protein [Thermoleophilia bacterium]